MACELCPLTTFKPCPICALKLQDKETWDKLTTPEKAKAVAYRNILVHNKEASNAMVNYISGLHTKYPDFNMALVP